MLKIDLREYEKANIDKILIQHDSIFELKYYINNKFKNKGLIIDRFR